MTWEEALDALEENARSGRTGPANDARVRPFAPPPGPLPEHLRERAEALLVELREAEAALQIEFDRVRDELGRLEAERGLGLDRSV